MTISGTLTSSEDNKPIGGAVFSVYYTGNLQGPPNGSFTSGSDGSYSYTNAELDTAPQPSISVQAPGFLQAVGTAEFFDGPNQLDPDQVTVTKSVLPGWVWIVIALAAIFGFIYINKKYKLV